MPNAESNPLPKNQPYGQRKAQEQAMSEAPPPQEQQMAPAQANVHQPEPPPNPRDLPQPDQQVVPGAPLNPEDATVLFQPGSIPGASQDAQHLIQWLPVLQEIASQPGASQGMKQLSDAVTRWFGAQGATP